MALVSALGFSKICNWVFDPRYEIRFNYEQLEEGDKVFVNLDYLHRFVEILYKYKPEKKFILLTHNADNPFTDAHFNMVNDYVLRIYAINNICDNINVITIPLAFQDYPKDHFKLIISNAIKRDSINKNNLLYMNFSIHTNVNKRQVCYDVFNNYNWVTKRENITKEEFMNDILESKYVLSPEGTGIDCHRIYESIICGTIPIVHKTGTVMDKFYEKLPVLLVDDWKIITKEYLEENYKTNKNKLYSWLKDNKGWTSANYWVQNIHFITFGDEKYANTLNRLKDQAIKSNFFNSINIYSSKNFESDFEHKQFIENNRRGYGYWIWKLYFVLKRHHELHITFF
jgi:hypothetical protein